MEYPSKSLKWVAMIMILAIFSCEPKFDQMNSMQELVLSSKDKPTLIPDKYIVVLKNETINFRKTDTYEDVQAGMRILSTDLAARYGISPAKVHKVYGNAISGFSAELTKDQARLLAEDPEVDYIEQDGYAYATDVVQQNATWGLDRIDQNEAELTGTYSYNSSGSDVTAYIFDTGIRYDHNEFGGRAKPGFDAYGADGSDVYGHGTHVAGTVGGTIYGVAKKVQLVSVKVLGDNGEGTWSGVIAGLDWVRATKSGPSVVNMSFGAEVVLFSISDAITEAHNAGIVVVVSAGNNAGDACSFSPAFAPKAITVGAASNYDDRAYFSNYGPCVDIFAPGTYITSSTNTSPESSGIKSGTSMSSPHVTGAAALYMSKNPTATSQQVADFLIANATRSIVTNSNSANNNLLYTGKSKKEK